MNDRHMLSRQIRDIAQVEAMDDDQLERMQAAHEGEIVKLENRAMFDVDDNRKAMAALRVLKLHSQWINRELRRRSQADAAAMSAAKKERRTEAAAEQRAAQDRAEAASMERIREANNENQLRIGAFKQVVKETLGEAAYLQLWEKAIERVAATTEG